MKPVSSVKEDGHEPFDNDIEIGGAYRYTDGVRQSARIANERYTEVILAAADFKGKSIVDVGSGDGTYTAHLARHSEAASVLGVEPSQKAADCARATYGDEGVDFVCGSSETLLAESRHFDVAVYRGVLHHVINEREELKRALTLANTVIFLEPNGCNPLMKLVEKVSPYHRQHRERSFTPSAVSRWIAEAGGRVERVRYFGLVPYFAPDVIGRIGQRLEPLIEWLPGIRAVCCGQYILVAQRNAS